MSSAETWPFSTLMFLEQLLSEAQLARQQVHDVVIVLALEDRFDELLAPLQRAVRGGARSVHFEAGTCRQDMRAVLALRQQPPGGRIGNADDQEIALLDPFDRLRHARNRVAALPHDEHALPLVPPPHLHL